METTKRTLEKLKEKLHTTHLETVRNLPYDDMGAAISLIDRGADKALLYFWFNLKTGCYDWMPQEILEADVERMKKLYPSFRGEIDLWVNKFIIHGATKKIRSQNPNYRKAG